MRRLLRIRAVAPRRLVELWAVDASRKGSSRHRPCSLASGVSVVNSTPSESPVASAMYLSGRRRGLLLRTAVQRCVVQAGVVGVANSGAVCQPREQQDRTSCSVHPRSLHWYRLRGDAQGCLSSVRSGRALAGMAQPSGPSTGDPAGALESQDGLTRLCRSGVTATSSDLRGLKTSACSRALLEGESFRFTVRSASGDSSASVFDRSSPMRQGSAVDHANSTASSRHLFELVPSAAHSVVAREGEATRRGSAFV